MKLEIYFTEEEKQSFLKNRGYSLKQHNYSYWYQWGNHDSQGEWEEVTILCAVKEKQEPSENLEYQKVFEMEIKEKIKQILLF